MGAVRWDASGTTELGVLGTDPSGYRGSTARAINNAGTGVGGAIKYEASGASKGYRAVRWDPSGTAATELGHLGTDASGFTASDAYFVNDAGTAIGTASKYDAEGAYKGERTVRWDGSGTAATELGNLGRNTTGVESTLPTAINNAGTAVGYSYEHLPEELGLQFNLIAVRWDASGTAGIALQSPGGDSFARGINDAGTVVGGVRGFGAVRWHPSGAATVLGHLGTRPGGSPISEAVAINNAGTAIGTAHKYGASGNYLGIAAVRWDASGTAATELGNLQAGFESPNFVSVASAINEAGTSVGFSTKYRSGTALGAAVYWGRDGAAIDLNTLIDPAAGWYLWHAMDISDAGWISGYGDFDPDGPGGQAAYLRQFLMHVPATALPEPATVALVGIGLVGIGVGSRGRAGRSTATVT